MLGRSVRLVGVIALALTLILSSWGIAPRGIGAQSVPCEFLDPIPSSPEPTDESESDSAGEDDATSDDEDTDEPSSDDADAGTESTPDSDEEEASSFIVRFQDDATPAADDEDAADDEESDAEATEESTPEADESDSEQASSDPVVEGLRRLIRAVAACQTAGDYETLVRLVTPAYLGDAYAGGGRLNRADFLIIAEGLPEVRMSIRGITNLTVDGGEATAEVIALMGRQLTRAQWAFIEDDDTPGRWYANGRTPLAVDEPDDAERVSLRLRDGSYAPTELEAPAGDIVISASNGGDEDHEVLILQLPEGVTTADLLIGPGFPEGVELIAQALVPSGERAEVVLLDMPEGQYAIVDLLPTAEGIPNLSLGMEATLVVG